MIICDSKRTRKFKNVLYGSVFLWKGEYYMRTATVYVITDASVNLPRNAVNLEDGSMELFDENTIVHDIDGHFEAY